MNWRIYAGFMQFKSGNNKHKLIRYDKPKNSEWFDIKNTTLTQIKAWMRWTFKSNEQKNWWHNVAEVELWRQIDGRRCHRCGCNDCMPTIWLWCEMPVELFNSSKMATEYVSRCQLTWYDRILDYYTPHLTASVVFMLILFKHTKRPPHNSINGSIGSGSCMHVDVRVYVRALRSPYRLDAVA